MDEEDIDVLVALLVERGRMEKALTEALDTSNKGATESFMLVDDVLKTLSI
jgi:hypothetical protein